MKFLDMEQKEQVGYSFILDQLKVLTPYGIDEKNNIKPYKREEEKELIKEMDYIESIISSLTKNRRLYRKLENAFMRIKDIRGSLQRCRNGEVLDDVEIFEIKYFLFLVREVKEYMNEINLNIEELSVKDIRELMDILDPKGNKVPTFYIYEEYSTKLMDIREIKKNIEEKIIKEKDKERVGKLRVKRLQYVLLEEKEEMKVRKKLTKIIFKYVKDINKNIKIIGRLDFLIAKGKIALKYNGKRPNISKNMKIKIQDGFNPEIQEILYKKHKKFTPISIELKNGTTIITGANMGGKSITIKTIVLNLMLFSTGFFVFCNEAEIPLLDFIQFISDDMQNVSKGLSTFGAEIMKLNEVVSYIKKGKGFIALDEFARGTNPKEGYYLVKALSIYLNKFKSISLIATHYDGIPNEDMVHYQVIGLKNVNLKNLKYKINLNKNISVEIIQESMDYRLEKVSKENEVPKDAFNISELLGLEEEIIEITRNFYEKGNDYEG